MIRMIWVLYSDCHSNRSLYSISPSEDLYIPCCSMHANSLPILY